MVTRPPRQVPPPTRPEGDQPRGNTYSRIIPREELSGFAAWNPGSLDGGQAPRRPPVSAPPPVEPPAPPPPPQPSLDELLHAARQSGYQDGYRDGMAALEAFKQSFAKQISAQVGALVTSFDADLQSIEADMADSLARTAVELARQVVRSELATRPDLIAKVAHDAVETLLINARHVRMRVHPDDLPLVLDGAGEELRARETQVIPDPTIARGGCKVDADICSVDATLAARWQAAVNTIGQSSVWEDRRASPEPAPSRPRPAEPPREELRMEPGLETRTDPRTDPRMDPRSDPRGELRNDFREHSRSASPEPASRRGRFEDSRLDDGRQDYGLPDDGRYDTRTDNSRNDNSRSDSSSFENSRFDSSRFGDDTPA